ncbi:PIR Superfamily Protein [Plasmodium ovale wallikeri]|uniref:PIR Superfamily Protein n=2 Tax=Plasmodium ovale TaxID=36330 RepID=A0A1A9AH46_PLAOA|nr:PIR Superfamily Protein [Plasmodium ovale wallikeri]SBT56740.1 PIR Superfamily Protein [Plasmodium ovale wallikeri]SBT73005.1 PIR protein [Plasmodium ovale]
MSAICGCNGDNSHDTPDKYALNFNVIPKSFNIKKQDIIDYIEKIDDPFLQQVSLYLTYYYQQGAANFSKCRINNNRTTACQYLNQWSWHIKNIFTCSEKCTEKNELWKIHINKLWELLKTNFTNTINSRNTPWCNRYDKHTYNQTPVPDSMKSAFEKNVNNYCNSINAQSTPTCEPNTTLSTASVQVFPPSDSNPICPAESSERLSQQGKQSSEISNLNYSSDIKFYIALSSLFTFLGTISIIFLLYKFTPLKSWIIRSSKSKKGIDRYINDETDEFLNTYENSDMPTKNRRNHLFYHSMED